MLLYIIIYDIIKNIRNHHFIRSTFNANSGDFQHLTGGEMKIEIVKCPETCYD
jgi:hypothetical protein